MRRAGGVFCNRREHLLVVYPEALGRNRGAEASVQHDGVRPLEGVDRHAPGLAFRKKPRRRVEAREIVQHSGQTGFTSVEAVALREDVGTARDAHRMFVAMVLREMFAHAARELAEGQG